MAVTPIAIAVATRLMYRATQAGSWILTSRALQEMLEQNGNISWFPEYLSRGSFAKTVESAPDWNLSKSYSFWATAMPVWKGVDEQMVKSI